MTVSVAPRSVSSRAMGQCTILMHRPGGLTTADASEVTAYLPGTTTPYPEPLYGDPDTLTPLVFPVTTGEDGVVVLWADTPARLELEAVHAVLGRGRVVLDLEPEPSTAVAVDAYTKEESDGRYPLKTDPDAYPQYATDVDLAAHLAAPDAHSQYLTEDEADELYLSVDYVPPASGISQADADLRYVNTAGDVMTGALTAVAGTFEAYALTPALYVDGPGGTDRVVHFRSSGVPRWRAGASSAGETGSNAGTGFLIDRYDDAGTLLGTALTLSRATGAATFGGAVTAPGVTATGPLLVFDPTGAGASVDLYALPGYPRRLRGLNQATGHMRWELYLGNTAAETGSDAGSDFSLIRRSDGEVPSTALTITRATGAATFGGALSTPGPITVGGTAQPKITVASSAPSSPATGDLWVW